MSAVLKLLAAAAGEPAAPTNVGLAASLWKLVDRGLSDVKLLLDFDDRQLVAIDWRQLENILKPS